jgi:cytoskeleton protein RodZ
VTDPLQPDAASDTRDRAGSEPPETAFGGQGERREARDAPRLGRLLREARERAGMGLSDMAEVTHVRRVYLLALEEGRYADLPEDVYARNFVRLYANAVGLDAAELLGRYAQERRQAVGFSTLEQRLERDRRSAMHASPAAAPAPPPRRRKASLGWLAGPWLPTLGLIAVVVGLAIWGFNGLFATGLRDASRPTAPGAAATTPGADAATPSAAAAGAAAPGAAAEAVAADAADAAVADPAAADPAGASQVRVDIVTDPPGAAVTIDGFPIPGVTPLFDIPVTAREGRLVRAELDGYQAGEVRADLRTDAEVTLALSPLSAAASAAAAGAASEPGSAPAAGTMAGDGRGSVLITVTDTAWLEVYRSVARNEGERLVFTTAQGGQVYQFEPPVFVYTGNAAGVRLSHGGQDLGPMGSPGAVLGRAFPQ